MAGGSKKTAAAAGPDERRLDKLMTAFEDNGVWPSSSGEVTFAHCIPSLGQVGIVNQPQNIFIRRVGTGCLSRSAI
jgi:hypothetical protein